MLLIWFYKSQNSIVMISGLMLWHLRVCSNWLLVCNWRWQWESVVLGLEKWSQFPASPNNCTAWYIQNPILFIHSFTIILFIAVRLLLKMGKISNVEWLSVSGSLDSEAGIYALCYDVTGSRLVTCEADKTIKMWREDETATPETHPLNFKPPKDIRRF